MSDTISSPANEPLEPLARVADATPEQLAEQRYLAAVGKLVDDATEHGHVGVLADTLAWTIARLIVGCGVPAAGDILRRVGGYVGDLSERRRAEEEMEQARKEGRPMH